MQKQRSQRSYKLLLLLVLFPPAALPQAASHRDGKLHQADLAFHQGYAAVQNGDLAAARIAFQKVVLLAPQIPEGHGALGSVLLQLGQPAQAVPELERALAIKPDDRETRINLAIATEAIHSYDKSLTLFGALDQDPTKPLPITAVLSYVRALATTRSPDFAAARLHTALADAPQNSADAATLHDAFGSLLAQQKNWPAAQSEFEQALAIDPGLATAHEHLGVTLFAEQRIPEAIVELTTATQFAPAAPSAHLELGRTLIAAGRDADAIPSLQRALELAPDSIDAKYQLALALQGSGQEAQSIPFFQQVVAAQPRDAAALTNLALALVQTGKSGEAVPLYRRALAETPNDPLVHQDLGVAYLQQSDLDDAIREFRAGIEQSPNTYELHYNLGLALKLKDEAAAAETELKLAERLNPESPDPPFTLGILKMQKGQFDDAAKQLQAALKLDPNNGDAWAILGSVYKEENDLSRATDALGQAVRLLPNQPGPHITLAGVLTLQGRKDEAAAERKLAAELTRAATSRQRAAFAVNSGNLLLQHGKFPEAIDRFQEAVVSDPNSIEGHRGLAAALANAGRNTEAEAERQKLAQLQSAPDMQDRPANLSKPLPSSPRSVPQP